MVGKGNADQGRQVKDDFTVMYGMSHAVAVAQIPGEELNIPLEQIFIQPPPASKAIVMYKSARLRPIPPGVLSSDFR